MYMVGFYTSGHRRVQPRAAEAEFHGFQCGPDSCSEYFGLNNDLLWNSDREILLVIDYFLVVQHIPLLNGVIVNKVKKF